MRTEREIYDIISKAMYNAMSNEWEKLTTEEKEAYKLNMHGLEMYVSTRSTS